MQGPRAMQATQHQVLCAHPVCPVVTGAKEMKVRPDPTAGAGRRPRKPVWTGGGGKEGPKKGGYKEHVVAESSVGTGLVWEWCWKEQPER